VLGVGSVHAHLVEVLLTSSLSFCPFSIEVDTDFDHGLLLPRDKGLLPLGQLLLLHKDLLLQLLHRRRRHRG
jgi:hypothetical protein